MKETHVLVVSRNGDIFSLGADDLRLDVTFLLVRDPAHLLAVERLVLLLCQLPRVGFEELEIFVQGHAGRV